MGIGKKLYKQKYGAAALKKLERKVTKLAKVATPEIKFHDTAVTTASAVTLVKVPISLIAQGDTDSLRDGDEIMLKNLYIKGSVSTSLSAANIVDDQIRIILLQDFQQDADATAFTTVDLLQSDVWNSFYKADGNQKRFKILSDRMHHMGVVCEGTQNAGTESYQSTASNKYITQRVSLNRKMYFNGVGDTLANQGRGKLYMCYISERSLHTMDFQVRLTFQDS